MIFYKHGMETKVYTVFFFLLLLAVGQHHGWPGGRLLGLPGNLSLQQALHLTLHLALYLGLRDALARLELALLPAGVQVQPAPAGHRPPGTWLGTSPCTCTRSWPCIGPACWDHLQAPPSLLQLTCSIGASPDRFKVAIRWSGGLPSPPPGVPAAAALVDSRITPSGGGGCQGS